MTSNRQAVIQLAGRKGGVSNAQVREALGLDVNVAATMLSGLTSAGLLFRGGSERPHAWFTNQHLASCHVALPGTARGDRLNERKVVSAHWRRLPSKSAPQPINPRGVQAVTLPCGQDHRYTVRELPAGYVSGLDPRECRPWARSVAE